MQPIFRRFTGFEGVELAADVWGDDDAWLVLLMHGGGQTRHAWGNTARLLADAGWRAVSLDLRGHGDSDWAPALANIHVPTLLVRGLLSDVVTEEGVREFLRKVPHAKLADVKGAAHMVAGDENDAFSSAVIRFLEQDVRPILAA